MGQHEGRAGEAEADDLIAMNARVMVAYIRDQDPGPLREQARDDFFVVSPVGFEDVAYLLDHVGELAADAVVVETVEVRLVGETAIVAGRLHLRDGGAEGGAEGGGTEWPPLAFLTVYVREDGRWRLAARSITPQRQPDAG